jgi:hypothetical protein
MHLLILHDSRQGAGVDGAGTDGVDAHPRRELSSQVPSHVCEGRLADAMSDERGESHVAGTRGDVDDAATAGGIHHCLCCALGQQKRRDGIEMNRGVQEAFRGHHRGSRGSTSSVVDQDVESTEHAQRLSHQMFELV